MIRRIAASLTLLPLLLAACAGDGAQELPERIVLIVVDTLRRDHVGDYGARHPTPHLDRIAEGGTVFTGALLDGLEERGLLEDAVVVLTSDHGESLGERHFRPPRPRHAGNPSFEPVLRVPLIVGGRRLQDPERFLRGEDVFRLLVGLAGGAVKPSQLEPEELFVSERRFRTYRSGRWKSFWPRAGGPARLVDLQEDPGELRDVAAQRPRVVAAHRARVGALVRGLAAHRPVAKRLGPEAEERLRALGYLEPAYDLDVPVEELPGRAAPDGGG